ncbi:Piso0_001462 [Millerozyma farinosa CBS 7064]|uniref:Piso0_001462 protein n=1 Tax=Pichia sorbitophila (strain ATCC MYA-4447 / BCRC 22081 / CBS 7064 / NBRC 10061 / NRRL Y-12695) TaxID=559304 RepID=G8YN84_PICSO|nr:Piso0_001462 [Millerozyma farinosa CBS 7064]
MTQVSSGYVAEGSEAVIQKEHDEHGEAGEHTRLLAAEKVSAETAAADAAAHKRQTPKQSIDHKLEYEEPGWFRKFTYDLLLWLWSVIFDCFFREIRPRGAFKLPRKSPLIFVAAPHANQFADPIVLMNQVKRESGRRISFLIAAKSYKQRFIGFFSRCQMSIPVVRAQDNLEPGSGKIRIDMDADRLLVKGEGTKFTEECMEGGLLSLPRSLGATQIMDIISDTELTIRKEFKDTAKIRDLLNKGTTYKRADKVNQNSVYQLVFKNLSKGHCIGIFPEGGSHDRTDLLPLKAGVAIMALGAMEHYPDCNIKIVPCGMNYFNAHKFRSRAVVEFGDPIEISRELVERYSNPETNREAVKELLDTVSDGLKAVTVTCTDYETLMVVQAARRLYSGNFSQYLPLPLVVEMNRRLVLGYQTFKNEESVKTLKEKILKYNDKLKHLYLPDHHVEDCDETHKLRVVPILVLRIMKLIFLMLCALPGAVLFSPVFFLSKRISQQKQKTALANSTVKIKGNDVVATWKILISLGFAPLLYSFYATIGTIYCYKNETFQINLFFVWFFIYMCGVLVTYAALITGEQGMDLFKSIRPLYLSLVSGSSIREVKNMRNELSEEITYLVNQYGPQLFPNDFNLYDLQRKPLSADGELIDSEEEEDLKTTALKERRNKNRKASKATKIAQEAVETEEGKENSEGNESSSELSLRSTHSDSVSDGISLMNSDNSLTDIPMFSDYHLHKNAKNPDVLLDTDSSTSLKDQANFKEYSNGTQDTARNGMSRSSSSSQIEFNFVSTKDRKHSEQNDGTKLSHRIKNKIMEGRERPN